MNVDDGSEVVTVSSRHIRASVLATGLRLNVHGAGLLALTRAAQDKLAAIYAIEAGFLARLASTRKHQPIAAQLLNHFFHEEPKGLCLAVDGERLVSLGVAEVAA